MNKFTFQPFIFIISIFFLSVFNSCTGSEENKNCPEGAICNDNLQTTETGLKYIHHIHYPENRKPEYNEIMTMHYLLLADNGDTITDTYKLNEPVGQPLLKPAYRGAIEEGFRMLNVGDSATFYVVLDSIKDTKLPIGAKTREQMKEIRYVVKLYNTQSKAAFDIDEEVRLKKRTQEQIAIQDKKIVEYMKKELVFEGSKKHPLGLYYRFKEKGTGMPAQLGDSVSFTYQTWTIPFQQVLDQSKKGETVGFVVGARQVLPAWQIAFTQIANEGSKLSLFSPSRFAFGNKDHQGIPPFTMLRFEIEVVDIVRKNEMKK
ncbi:FKBP-type peptidyl-prolyl cis-trans isomerase [Bernardetia sp. Wsw4-3y2]|uniref:FKBP-type peptidyl-prolyl cis-trans isomerase n=1 Tax=Bernardetia sp. Wsw4-3y2 TaxID=3127471 RepID=UPI0030CB854F